jgi:hypothetical protein
MQKADDFKGIKVMVFFKVSIQRFPEVLKKTIPSKAIEMTCP